MTVGKATQNAKAQAVNQIEIILLTKPTLKIEITNDIKPDINNAIKKANTIVRYLALNMNNLLNKKAEINSAFMINLKSARYWQLTRRGNPPPEDILKAVLNVHLTDEDYLLRH